MNRFIVISIFIVFFNSMIMACTIFIRPEAPVSHVRSETYIFVGEVVGYTEVVKSKIKVGLPNAEDKFYGEGRGLRIKPLEIVNFPGNSGDLIELFQFGVNAWCLPQILDANFPVGTKLRIVAGTSNFVPDKSAENKTRLESNYFERLSVVSGEDEFFTDSRSIFDYKIWKPLQAKIQESTDGTVRKRFSDFMFMEITKDLVRLEKEVSEKEKLEILGRLLYAPFIDYPKIIDPNLGQLNWTTEGFIRQPGNKTSETKLTTEEKTLLKKRKKMEKAGYFGFGQTGFFIL